MAGVEQWTRARRFGGPAPVTARSTADRPPERDRLRALSTLHVVGTSPEREFDAIAALAARIGAAEGAAVTFVDDEREFVKASAGLDLPEAPRFQSFGDRVIMRGGPVVVEDARCDPFAGSYPWVAGDPGVRFYAGVPVLVGGAAVGALALVDREPRAASDWLIDALADAAEVLAPHLQRRREEAMAQNLISVLDAEGRIERVSAAVGPVLGWRPDELAGRYALEFVHPDDMTRAEALLAGVASGDGPPESFECRYRGKDGRHRWILWNFDFAPEEGRLYCAGKDITDRKRHEAALRESEARYRLLAENATDMIAGHNLDGTCRYVSTAGQTLTGFDPNDLIGKTAYEMVHPDDQGRIREAHRQLLDGGPPVRLVMRLRRKEGGWLWVESVARLVRDQNSRPIGMQSATRDVTETKRAVEALEAAREHFRSAFDDAPIGMGIVDRGGHFERVNVALYEFLGYDEDELLGRNPLELISPADRGGEERGLSELLHGARRTFAIEKRVRHKDGHWVLARITTSVMRDEPGAQARLLTHVEDISEAERANRAKSEFLLAMSHELRTPLNAVLGFAQLIRDDDEASESQRESAERILRGGHHLLNVVNDVLDISAIESGQLPMPTEPVPTAALVREAMDLMRPLADDRAIAIRCDLPAVDVLVKASGQRLKQVLLNLVSNAIKYSLAGAEVAISVIRAGDGRARIAVADTGPGIPSDRLERAFAPFERLGAGREVEGTGLGLPLSRNLVRAMGGRLTAQSGPDGSTFTIELPLA